MRRHECRRGRHECLRHIGAIVMTAAVCLGFQGREVGHELVTLPGYGVFDNLTYQVQGGVVTLTGYVTRAALRRDAAQVVGKIEGVTKVQNQIKVLPTSAQDDRLRLAVYRAIYGQPPLDHYALQAVPPIHIVVENGRVTLEGEVGNLADRDMAKIRASAVPGVFSVTNNLRVTA